jgi:hypothetical protein
MAPRQVDAPVHDAEIVGLKPYFCGVQDCAGSSIDLPVLADILDRGLS